MGIALLIGLVLAAAAILALGSDRDEYARLVQESHHADAFGQAAIHLLGALANPALIAAVISLGLLIYILRTIERPLR